MANVSKLWAREYVILSARIAEQMMLCYELQRFVKTVDRYPAKFTAREIHSEVEMLLDRSAARFSEFLVSDDLNTQIDLTIGEFEEREEANDYEEF